MRSEVHTAVDAEARVATITTRFGHPAEVVWTLWSDPGKLARWWGPPGLPMTVDHHDLTPGGRVDLTVHAESSHVRGRWSVLAVEPPRSLRFQFSSDGIEPTDVEVVIEPDGDHTAMIITVRFASGAEFDDAIEIGFVEGVARACESAHLLL